MISLPRIPRYTRYEKLITFIIILFLFIHAFLPEFINIDRFTMALIGFLVLVSIMPTVSSAKLPYILEVKRKIKALPSEGLDGKDLKDVEQSVLKLKKVQREVLKDHYASAREIEELYDVIENVLGKVRKGGKG